MLIFILQTLLLLAIAYILGCIVGCWMHRVYGVKDKPIFAERSAIVPAVATVVAAPTATTIIRAPEPVAAQVVDLPAPVATPEPVPAAVPLAEPVAFVAPASVIAPVKPKIAAAPRKLAPKAVAAKAVSVIAPSKKDDLKRIKGIGPQNEARLNALGVTTFAQISSWSLKEEADYGERLAFPGRIEREEWVNQAKVLAEGGTTDFAKRVDKGQVSTSMGKGSAANLGKAPKVLAKPRGGKADNLTLIDGVGNAIEKRLFALGIYHFEQIAKMSEAEAIWLGNEIGFPGRVQREGWVAESQILASGGITEHARRVESGGIASSHKTTATKAPARKKT